MESLATRQSIRVDGDGDDEDAAVGVPEMESD